jgi:hypothetical protein
MKYILDRMHEKATHGGIGLMVVGVLMLLMPMNLFAYAAIAYGAYQVLTEG